MKTIKKAKKNCLSSKNCQKIRIYLITTLQKNFTFQSFMLN